MPAQRLMRGVARWVAAAGVTLVASAAGDPPAVWVAFTPVHRASAGAEGTRHVDLLIGSNETESPARVFAVTVDLTASDARGRVVCRASAALRSSLRPDAARPLRVQVRHRLDSEEEGAGEYTIAATAAWKSEGTPEWRGTSVNRTTIESPDGATVQCLKRP